MDFLPSTVSVKVNLAPKYALGLRKRFRFNGRRVDVNPFQLYPMDSLLFLKCKDASVGKMLGNRTLAGSTASSLVNGLKRAQRSLNARQKRILTILSILVGSLLIFAVRSLLRNATKASSDQEAETVVADNETGWAGSYLHKLADPNINNAVDEISKRSIYNGCQGNLLSLGKAANFSTLEEVADMLGSIETRLSNGQQRFIQATAFSVPCQP